MGHVLEALDQVRRKEQATLKQVGDRHLTGSTFLRLPLHVGCFSRTQQHAFARPRTSTSNRLARWALREAIRRLWDFRSIPRARAVFARWKGWACRSRLASMRYLTMTLRRHLDNILTYLAHRITNAVTEGLNAKIQWIKYSSRGYRDRERFKLAIYFHTGDLDLEPARLGNLKRVTPHSHTPKPEDPDIFSATQSKAGGARDLAARLRTEGALSAC